MYKKLDDTTIRNLLEAGICEFAEYGFNQANIADIAKRSGLSVGVIYKYFDGKDGFFLACVRHCLKLLDDLMTRVIGEYEDVLGNMELVIRQLVKYAREHTPYFVLYHEITAGGCRKFAKDMAVEIETSSAKVYGTLFRVAKEKGLIRKDMDPYVFAFFFDNLLMMLQFSFSCDYYRERMRIFCDGDREDEVLIAELMKFMRGALGIA